MTISSITVLLDRLHELKCRGGKLFKESNRLSNLEATTDNLELIQVFVRENY